MKTSPFCLSYVFGVISTCLSTTVVAQQSVPGSAISSSSSASSADISPSLLQPVEVGSSPAVLIKPRIAFTETWSDNVDVSRGQGRKQSAFITELAPGVRIEAKTAHLKAYFDYTLREQVYSSPSNYSRTLNSLNSFGTLEAIDKWLFLDFSGVIAQQAISAFDPQSTNSSSINSNNTETGTYRISPYIRGQLFKTLEYSLRYNWSTTQASSANVSDIDLSEWAGQLRGSTPFHNLKWAIDANQQTADYSHGRSTDSERLTIMTTYTVIPQFRISFSGGRESNNYASATQESHATYGYGFDWTPSERTKISTFQEQRFFGKGHRFDISHRLPLSSISYTDSKDVSILPNQYSSAGMGTVFDLFHQICSQQLSNQYADPIQLDQASNVCASTLVAQSGVSPNTQVVSSFLASRATIQRRQQLSLAMQGARNTLTLMLNRNDSQSIIASNLNDDFSNKSINNIQQKGFSVNFSHQLSAVSNINLTASRQESTSTGNTALKTTTMLYQAGLIYKQSQKTTTSIALRRSEFDSSTNPYTENAVIGTISIVF